jgi:site-specific DNA-methyltransferase (adenine-specific)
MTVRDRAGDAWRALLSSPQPSDSLRIQQLVETIRDVERDRFDLGVLAGPRRRDEPGYRWLPYKEAFSPGLARAILDHWSEVDGMLLDPFAGSATSLLVAAERGLASVGVELLPYAQWGADTIVRAHAADSACFLRMTGEAAEAARARPMGRPLRLPVPAASWAVSGEVGGALLALREALPQRGSGVEADLARLVLTSIVESVSMSVKDGTSLRHRDRERIGRTSRPGRKGQQVKAAEVIDAFTDAAEVIGDDLVKMPDGNDSRVLLGDARRLPLGDAVAGSAVFSPPYPNRYDYSAIYQLELAAGDFVRAPEDLRRIRKSLLRSHLEAPPPDSSLMLDDPVVLAVLRMVSAAAEGGPAERGRTLRMLVGYFDDMCHVFAELARVLRSGAPAACVVGTQTFFGCSVPTDVMLASIARHAGLVVEGLWVLRHKRVAVQQRARGGVVSSGGRESVLLLRRP